MRQGRKSRWTTRAFCMLAPLLIAALAAPAASLADAPATEEYELDLPAAEGDSNGNSNDEEGAAVAPPTSTPPTAPQAETVAPTTPEAPAERDREGGEGASDGPSNGLFDSPAPNRQIRNLPAADSGDGGFPALLLLLGVIAGTSIGFAIWRLRRDGRPGKSGGSAGTDVSAGTQSP